MKVNPLGVKQSAPEASEQVFHFTRVKSIQLKLASVFRPLPIPAVPDVAVR
jgi:hypothetical protein